MLDYTFKKNAMRLYFALRANIFVTHCVSLIELYTVNPCFVIIMILNNELYD